MIAPQREHIFMPYNATVYAAMLAALGGYVMRAVILSAILLVVLSSSSLAQEIDEAARIERLVSELEWGMTVEQFDSVMTSMCRFTIWDFASEIHRYAEDFDMCRYEIIPGYMEDSLRCILIRFYTGHKYTAQMEDTYNRLCKVLKSPLGKPCFHGEKRKMTFETSGVIDLTHWSTPGADWIAGQYEDKCYHPQLALVGVGPRMQDWLGSRSPVDTKLKHEVELKTFLRNVSIFPSAVLLEDRELTPLGQLIEARKEQEKAARAEMGKAESDDHMPESGDFVEVERMPVQTKREPPVFPAAANAAGASGTVWIQALLDKKGTVREARIMKPSGTCYGFEDAALAAAYKNKYKPAIQHGKPVAVWVSYKVEFRYRHE